MKKMLFICLLVNLTSILYGQHVEYDSIKINGLFPAYPSVELIRSISLITKTEPISDDFDIQDFDSLIYLGKSEFELVIGKENLNPRIIRFDEVINHIVINGITLDSNSSPAHVDKILPGECSNVSELDVYQEGKYDTCSIPLGRNGIMYDSRLLFFFRNNKLMRIDFWAPI